MSISPSAVFVMPISPDVAIRLARDRPPEPRDRRGTARGSELEGRRLPLRRIFAQDLEALEDTWHDAEVRLVEGDGLLARPELRRLPLRVQEGAPGDVGETGVVTEDDQPPLPHVERPVLERPQETLDRRVARRRELAERALLGRRCSEPTRRRLPIQRAGPGGRDAAEPGQHPRRREDDGERAHYDLSDSHIRLPPTTSKEPLPPLLQSQSRPGYVTSLHGAGRTHDLVFQTTSN